MFYVTLVTDEPARIQAIIDTQIQLNEVVQVVALADVPSAGLLIRNEVIESPLDWAQQFPPIILPEPLALTPDNLLALICLHLGNWESVYEHSQHDHLLADTLDLLNRLQSDIPVVLPPAPVNGVGEFNTYQRWHNRAVMAHYGNVEASYELIVQAYEAALLHAPNADHRAFTAKQYATLLADGGQLDSANALLTQHMTEELSADARMELLAVQSGIWLQQLTIPYEDDRLARTKDVLWQVLQHYEMQNRPVQVGMLLLDVAQVANFQNSFAEALGYVTRALNLFRQEDMPELLANAQYRKGVLLYTWAQNGSPQFYRPAMEAYQEALKLFTQQKAPAIFAEIQHHLGVIYAEIPDEVKKKGIWAAVSSSSFKHALDYYTKGDFPYEYAAICNHFANALTKYPQAAKSDNYAKAINLYREALAIRTAGQYPYERALTILNYLEAGWYVGEDDSQDQRALHNDMVRKATEIQTLVADEALQLDAERHLNRLQQVEFV